MPGAKRIYYDYHAVRPAVAPCATVSVRPLLERRSADQAQDHLQDCWRTLSPRQRQVTLLACQGQTNDQIAFQLGLSAGTVKTYLQQVFFKTLVSSKAELRLKFARFDFMQEGND